jgi:phosphopantetheine adenylyltransferase
MPGKTAVGGTFAVIHSGHHALFAECVNTGLDITVGITLKPLAYKYHPVPSFDQRTKMVLDYFKLVFDLTPEIYPLADHYGPVVLDSNYKYLVTSEENLPYACEINNIRQSKGFEPVAIRLVRTVKAFDGRPISTTRFLNGEIDLDGGPQRDRIRRICEW